MQADDGKKGDLVHSATLLGRGCQDGIGGNGVQSRTH